MEAFSNVSVERRGDLVRVTCPPLHQEIVYDLLRVECHSLRRSPTAVSFEFSADRLDQFRAIYERGVAPTLRLPTRLIVYYDYVSPFAYAAVKLVETLESEYDIFVEWRGLELRPQWVQFPAWWFDEQASQPRWLERREVVTRYGLPMLERRPNFRPRTRPLLMATEYAKHHGRFREFQRAVFEAYYARAEDIRDLEVVAELGRGVGLDPVALRTAVMEAWYEERIERWRRQAEAELIFGVPTFKIGAVIIWGREPLEELRAALEEHGAAPPGDRRTA